MKLMEDRAYLDGFKQIISISDNKISLLYAKYELILEGERFKISAFTKAELILFGKIDTVHFNYFDEL